MSEIEFEHGVAVEVGQRLAEIRDELMHPRQDPFTGEMTRFIVTDPNDFWDDLRDVRTEQVEKLKDAELRENLEREIAKVDQEVYQQFIPYLESMIDVYGRQNSPLEEHKPRYQIDQAEIEANFDQARWAAQHFHVTDEQRTEYDSELERLQEKFDRYQNEPGLFTFERKEAELQQELHDVDFQSIGWGYGQAVEKGLSASESTETASLRFEILYAKVRVLHEVAGQMSAETIRKNCEARAASLKDFLDFLKAESDAPRELLSLEGQLKDLMQRLTKGEPVEDQELESIDARLLPYKKGVGAQFGKLMDRLIAMSKKARRLMSGETVDEDEDHLSVGYGDIYWAWVILGVDREASEDTVKSAYRRLVMKYHPDRNRIRGANEKMQQINEAFECITRVKKWRKNATA
jgi:hypothetical protein